MGKHRTPQERMQALQAQMTALNVKANKAKVAENPKVKALDSQIAALNTSALKYKRWSKDAADNEARHVSRAEKWANRQGEADSWLENYAKDLANLKEQRAVLAAEVAKGM